MAEDIIRKLPFSAIAEQSLLGSILIDPQCINLVADTISSGADGRLYGSVTTKDIAEALKAQYKIDLDKRKLVLNENIKSHGTYNVEAKVYPEVSAKFKVTVTE